MPDREDKPVTALAFDFGIRHIGTAVGQTLTGTGRPLVVLKARDGQPDWLALSNLLDEWRPAVLLVGLPLNMDDSESEFSARARKFARRLHGRFGLPVKMVDERLSTREAKERDGALRKNSRSRDSRASYRKEPVDNLAAQVILEAWLADRDCGRAP
jgi:putative Holliday junction resolvase